MYIHVWSLPTETDISSDPAKSPLGLNLWPIGLNSPSELRLFHSFIMYSMKFCHNNLINYKGPWTRHDAKAICIVGANQVTCFTVGHLKKIKFWFPALHAVFPVFGPFHDHQYHFHQNPLISRSAASALKVPFFSPYVNSGANRTKMGNAARP